MYTYHGTSSAFACLLASGGVNVTNGGGELGQGFYTGGLLFLAKAWAFQRFGDKQKNVVSFETPDDEVQQLTLEILDHSAATLRRNSIRRANKTRTYCFGVDMVWAPIVGKERISGDQCKWESTNSERFLNGTKTTRKII